MTELLAKGKTTPVFVSHPVYQYWTRAYGLNVKSVHWEPDTLPSPEQWNQLEQLNIEHKAKWMLWEGEPIDASVKRLAAMGIQSATFSPCGNQPDNGDYLQVMRQNLAQLGKVFRDE